MQYLIIPADRVEKLRSMTFDGFNVLYPIEGELDGKKVYFLQAELKENKIFAKALLDFEASEIKEIENIDVKHYDSKGDELPLESKDFLTSKTILIVKP